MRAARQRSTEEVPDSVASFCLDSVLCSCETTYIGSNTRHLLERNREYQPPRPNAETVDTRRSAMITCLDRTNRTLETRKFFLFDLHCCVLYGQRR